MHATLAAPLVGIRPRAVRAIARVAFAALVGLSCVQPVSPFAGGVVGSLTVPQRRALFDSVWSHVDKRYYEATHHGVDWNHVRARYAPLADAAADDDALHALLVRMVAELQDAHSRYLPPAEAAAHRARISRGIGAVVAEVDGMPVIEAVADDSPAQLAGLEPGMRIVAVDGERIEERYERLLHSEPGASTARATRALIWRRTIAGRDSVISLTVEQHGRRHEVAAPRQPILSTPRFVATMLPDSTLYLRFDAFRVPIAEELRDSLRAHPGAAGIVLDLRNNGGGDAAETIRAAGVFLPRRVSAGEFFSRIPRVRFGFLHTRDRSRVYTGGKRNAETRPLAILTSALSGSGAELLSVILQEEGRATIVGDTTCGCLTAVTDRVTTPGGGLLMISNRGYKTRRGTVVEGRGVVPDVVVHRTREDLVARRDPVLEAARALVTAPQLHATGGSR